MTPFANDPVADPTGEAIYLRDDETGVAWTVTPGPLPRDPSSGRFVIRHQAGVTRFTRATQGIGHELQVFVDVEDPVKLSLLRVTNPGPQARRLSLFSYTAWILGPPRPGMGAHVVTEVDPATGAILAQNLYNARFPGHVGFSAANVPAALGDRRPAVLPGA